MITITVNEEHIGKAVAALDLDLPELLLQVCAQRGTSVEALARMLATSLAMWRHTNPAAAEAVRLLRLAAAALPPEPRPGVPVRGVD